MIGVDAESALVIVSAAAVAALVSALVSPRLLLPVVVVELLLGIAIGPQGADLAHVDSATRFFSNLGLGMLFFFAGYEIDFERIKGRPLLLGAGGWLLSLAIAYGLAGILFVGNVIDSDLYTGSAMATTAIGTLIPILHDSGELRTRFGTLLLGAGAMGEFGPILLVTLVLTSRHPLHEALILVAFIGSPYSPGSSRFARRRRAGASSSARSRLRASSECASPSCSSSALSPSPPSSASTCSSAASSPG